MLCIYLGLTAAHLLRGPFVDGDDLSLHGFTGLRQVLASSLPMPPQIRLGQNGTVVPWAIAQDRWEATDVRTSVYNGYSRQTVLENNAPNA